MGKTTVAKAMVTEACANFINVSLPPFVHKSAHFMKGHGLPHHEKTLDTWRHTLRGIRCHNGGLARVRRMLVCFSTTLSRLYSIILRAKTNCLFFAKLAITCYCESMSRNNPLVPNLSNTCPALLYTCTVRPVYHPGNPVQLDHGYQRVEIRPVSLQSGLSEMLSFFWGGVTFLFLIIF